MPKTLSAALLVVFFIVAACGGSGTAEDSNGQPVSSPSAPAGHVELTVATDPGADLKFEPAEVRVPASAIVFLNFENRSTVPHNLAFSAPIDTATATVVEPGSSETLEFTAPGPGIYTFVCTLHPGMAGTLTVE